MTKYEKCPCCGNDDIPHRYNQCQALMADGRKCGYLFDETFFKKKSEQTWEDTQEKRMSMADFEGLK